MIDPSFSRPALPGVVLKVGSGWGPRGDHTHHGLDIAMVVGTPLIAMADGVVIHADGTDDSEAGKHVAVRHPSGFVSRYLHMSRVDVRKGQAVGRGAILGLSGNTGRSDGPHLHLELRVPPELLDEVEAAVGKPSTGWGSSMAPYGIAVPGEPWVPVDDVRLTTIAKSHSYGIPFHSERERGVSPARFSAAPVALAGSVAVAAVAIAAALRRRRR
jgi:murein DD-endopeptidase MepM/ murein hydrolase activator NlpD